MMKPSLSEIYAHLNTLDKSNFQTYRISLLANITVSTLEPYLKYKLSEISLNAECQYGDYDNILQECLKPVSNIVNSSTNCIIVFLYLENFSQLITKAYPSVAPQEIDSEYNRIMNYISSCLSGIRQKTDAPIFWMGFNINTFPDNGIYDDCVASGQNSIINQLNQDLKKQLMQHKSAYYINMDLLLSYLGHNAYFDHRYYHLYQTPFTAICFQAISNHITKFICALLGKNKKCLIVDCDNVLWQGIIGEDGIEGISISKDYPGSMFCHFQQTIINLFNRGVIIVLCSKNNEADVFNVIDNKSGMLLKRNHITHHKINWEEKANNIRKIAEDLSISLCSMVFVDDSAHEIELVNKVLPEVATIHLPVETAYLNSQKLLASGYFDTITITSEDLVRNTSYAAQFQRKQTQSHYSNPEEYYKDLLMQVTIKCNDHQHIARLSQLTQKTNQFNLTTKRYSEADIARFITSENYKVLSVELKDKFGDFGIIGLAIVNIEQAASSATIDSFLLSCRAIGRGVEKVLLNCCLKLLLIHQITTLRAEYVATKSNQQVESFYQQFGFFEIAKIDNIKTLEIAVTKYNAKWPDYFAKVNFIVLHDSLLMEH